MKALAKDPVERHQTAREFARELKEAVEKPFSSPDLRPTEPLPPRSKPFPLRQVLLAAISLLLLGAGGWLAASHFRQSPEGGQSNTANRQPDGSGPEGINDQPKLPGIADSAGSLGSTPAPAPELIVELAQKGKGVVPPERIFRSGDFIRLICPEPRPLSSRPKRPK